MMDQSETINELAVALVAAQKEMPGVEKDAQGHGYRYASLDHIMSKVRPVLANHGLTVTQLPVSNGVDATGLTTRLIHESGQWLEATIYAPRDEGARRNSVQAAGSTLTYLRRYSIAALLGLVDESDTDGRPPKQNNGSGKPFYASAAKKIKYYKHGNHVKNAMKGLGLAYPSTGQNATKALAALKEYANLRANEVEQDEAVAIVTGKMGQPDDDEAETEAA